MQIKSHAKRKQNLGLTVTAATSQARRIVDRVMPGVMATVESKLSHDLATDTPIVITTVTFPRSNPNGPALFSELSYLNNRHGNMQHTAESVTITRKR